MKCRRAEQMRDERDAAVWVPPWRVERDLVDVLDEHVGPPKQRRIVRSAREKRERVPVADAENVDSVELCVKRTAGPTAAEQPHVVTLGG